MYCQVNELPSMSYFEWCPERQEMHSHQVKEKWFAYALCQRLVTRLGRLYWQLFLRRKINNIHAIPLTLCKTLSDLKMSSYTVANKHLTGGSSTCEREKRGERVNETNVNHPKPRKLVFTVSPELYSGREKDAESIHSIGSMRLWK